MDKQGIVTSLAGMGIAAAGMVAGLGVASAGAETMRMITYLPPTHFAVKDGMEPFMDCVKSGTAGAIDFEFFPSGQIANAAGSLDAVNGGLAQVAYIVPQQSSEKMPLSNIPVLPNMGGSAGEIVAAYRKALAGGGLLAGELADNNLTLLFVNQYPPYQVGFRDGPVETVADFAGKKLRVVGGSASNTASVLDAVPVRLEAGDVYVALQQGTIDGVFFPVSGMKQYNLNEVMKAVSSNASFGGSMAIIVMDSGTFGKLPADQQKIVLDCGMASEERLTAFQDAEQAKVLKAFAEQGITVYEFSPEVLAEMSARLDKTAEEFIANLQKLGKPGAEAMAEYQAALGR